MNLDFLSSIKIKSVCATTLLSGTTTCGITICGVNICGGIVCATTCFAGSGAGLTGTASSLTTGCATCAIGAKNLCGCIPASFLLSGGTAVCSTCAGNASTVAGCTPSCFLGATATALCATTAGNSLCLGGQLPTYYMTATAGLTGATNGLGTTGQKVCLGGALIAGTSITGNYALCLGTVASKLSAIDLHSAGNTTIVAGALLMSSSGATFTDLSSTGTCPSGIKYASDYSQCFCGNSLVNKAYVDSVATGLHVKTAVCAATTGPITLSGNQTIDGFATSTGNRILVKNQATATNNGIYSANTSTWGRTSDFNGTGTAGEVSNGDLISVTSGSTLNSSIWVLTTPDPITVGSTALSFSEFSTVIDVQAGAGIAITQVGGIHTVCVLLGSNCGLSTAGTGLCVNSNIAGSCLSYSSGVLNVCSSCFLAVGGTAVCATTAGNALSLGGNLANTYAPLLNPQFSCCVIVSCFIGIGGCPISFYASGVSASGPINASFLKVNDYGSNKTSLHLNWDATDNYGIGSKSGNIVNLEGACNIGGGRIFNGTAVDFRVTGCVSGSTKVSSPIICGGTCIISPITVGSTCACSPIILGSTCVCGAIVCSNTCVLAGSYVCATTSVLSGTYICATSYLQATTCVIIGTCATIGTNIFMTTGAVRCIDWNTASTGNGSVLLMVGNTGLSCVGATACCGGAICIRAGAGGTATTSGIGGAGGILWLCGGCGGSGSGGATTGTGGAICMVTDGSSAIVALPSCCVTLYYCGNSRLCTTPTGVCVGSCLNAGTCVGSAIICGTTCAISPIITAFNASAAGVVNICGSQASVIQYKLSNQIDGVSNSGFEIYDLTNTALRVSISSTGVFDARNGYASCGNIGGTGCAANFPYGFYAMGGNTNWLYGHTEVCGCLTDNNNTGFCIDGVGTACFVGPVCIVHASNPCLLINKTNATARPWYIQAAGDYLYIGCTSVVSLCIDTSANIVTPGNSTALDHIATSDCRVKTDIQPLNNSLSIIQQLCGVCYRLCDDKKCEIHLGLIAQDVEKVLPEIVSHGQPSEEDYKYGICDDKLGLKYDKLSAVLIEAIKEQQKQIKEQEKQLHCLCIELNYMRNSKFE